MNLFKGLADYLAGVDIKTPAISALSQERDAEGKLYAIEDNRVAMLVHGPGATDLLNSTRGDAANSAAFACLTAICTSYAEALPQTYRKTDPGEFQALPDSGLQRLLNAPNPHLDPNTLWWWVQWAKHVDGNAVFRKIRAGNPETGNVVQLWPISPSRIKPVTERGSSNFIDYYKYEYAPAKYEAISPENIIHFRLGLDDQDMRLGLSPLKRLVREVSTDEEATRFSDTLLKNFAVPGLVVMTPDVSITYEKAQEIKERARITFNGGNRGDVGVLSNGAKMEQFGFSPEQLDLKGLHRLPEERIAAVLRVPAIIAGLGAGLDRSTFANYAQAREFFTEQTILPLYASDAATLNMQLVRDFESDRDVFIAFDTSQLRALQEDQDSKFIRYDRAVRTGWIVPNEARAAVGLPPVPWGDEPRPSSATQQGDGGLKSRLLELKASDLEDFPELLEAIVALALPSFKSEMEGYFDGQRRRVKRALVSGGE